MPASIEGFTVSETIYEGASSLIYRGTRNHDYLPVIIKILNLDYPTPAQIARFTLEYKICRHIASDGIVKVISMEKCKNTFAIIMEDEGGTSLNNILKQGTIGEKEFLAFSIQITEILSEIHTKNVVHKDLNPSNIIWNKENGKIKIIDFGLSNMLSKENPSIVNPNVLEGTLPYMSPEQTGRMNRAIDYRTDYYSLGVIFYEMITGKLPFQTADAVEMIHSHIARVPTAPHILSRHIPEPISRIILKLMAKNAEDRYQSLSGLRYDLLRCLDAVEKKSEDWNFNIGEHDISDKFEISQKIYGREQEVKLLLNMFDVACSSSLQLMLVSGYSGIGKSVLVNEIHKPVLQKRGYFISGKFDQLGRSTPYDPLIQAFHDMVKQILTESEEEIAVWKNSILDSVGSNGQVIIDVIPKVELVIGKQPPIPDLPPVQAQNRFNMVFQNFVRALAASNHPLVIFIDDLQWADSSTLKMIELFMTDTDMKHLFVIGAYRENEVDPTHPLFITLNEIKKAGKEINTIYLKPLDTSNVSKLLCDTLKCNAESVQSLADICINKTNGNPFFLNQFLKSLYENSLIEFDSIKEVWTWDISKIEQADITDNVVELMASKIQKLSDRTQDILKLAACCGSRFDLEILSIINEKTLMETSDDLWEALREGLIIPIGNNYKLISDDLTNLDIWYKFSHDRVQQAAYSLIAEDIRKQVHYRIGTLLLNNIQGEARKERMFDIVNHLNMGLELISDQNEREYVAELNLHAGKKARISSAYELAYKYINNGIALLSNECWTKQYELALSLHKEAAETAYLNLKFDEVDKFVEELLKNAKELLEKTKIYEVKMRALIAEGKRLEAISTGIFVLKLLGVKLPEDGKTPDIIIGLLRIKVLLAGKKSQDICNIPAMTDELRLAAIRILYSILTSSYIVKPLLLPLVCFEIIRLSFKNGNNFATAFGYAGYAMVLFTIGDMKGGLKLTKVYHTLYEQFVCKENEPPYAFIYNYFISIFQRHLVKSLQELHKGYLVGMETGNFEWAACCKFAYVNYDFFIGREISELEKDTRDTVNLISKLKQDTILWYSKMYHQALINLLGRSTDPGSLTGDIFNEEEAIKKYKNDSDLGEICNLYTIRMMLNYLFEQYSQAAFCSEKAKEYLDLNVSVYNIPVYYFYDSLILLAVYKDNKKGKRSILSRVNSNQKKIKKFAFFCEENYLNKYYLVEAEKARVLDDDLEAMKFYHKAIKEAAQNGYINEEALANELAGKYYLSRGMEKVAKNHLMDARHCYLKWGAKAKLDKLEETYPDIFASVKNIQQTISSIYSTMSSTATASTTLGNISQAIDLTSIIKASQAISGEIVHDRLVEKLMKIVIESAGAERVILILEKDGNLYIDSEYNTNEQKVRNIGLACVSGNPDNGIGDLIPVSIINYVEHTNETVVLFDAGKGGKFTADTYTAKKHPRSVLCMPLIYQRKLKGILYLENNLTPGAFSEDRVRVLELLSAQMVISIENAGVYAHLEELVQKRTEELTNEIEERKKAEKLLEEMATHDMLTDLPNRRLFHERLEQILNMSKRNEFRFAVLFIDLDGFKAINDTMGHENGDLVLKAVAERLKSCVRKHETVARLGGDEFTVIMENIKHLTDIEIVAKRIIDSVAKSIPLGENQGCVTASVGISVFPNDGDDVQTLVTKADDAMYKAKNSGKNKYIFTDPA